ncbi:hypothetical protein ASD21_20365 [Caulobacter sp. Root1455]|nr:hypothetical protein ASD21_20365 [Caulobacter sp. Root1455]
MTLTFLACAGAGQAAPSPKAQPLSKAELQARRTAEALYAQARRQAKAEDFAAARTSLDDALKQDSTFDPARYLRATLHQNDGRYDLAVKDFDVLIAREPDQAALNNGRCWSRGLGNVELDLALADCETALKLQPGNAAILDSRGFVKLRKGDLAGAVADYDAALKASPDQAASLFGRGVAKRRQGAKAAGDADLAGARKVDPGVEQEFAGYGVTP